MRAGSLLELEQPDLNADARSDRELIAAIKGGDLDGFDVLYYRYRDWILHLAFRFTEDRDSALDVLQETFVYVARKLPGLVLTAQFKTFLYPVVKHCAIAARRKAQRLQGDNRGMDEMLTEPPGELNEVGSLLAPLTIEHREIVLLRFVEGFSLQEVAEAMGLALGTVKSRLHYALKALREHPGTKEFFYR